jgi:DNA-directed RNA polymerase subunit E'/Rpb7
MSKKANTKRRPRGTGIYSHNILVRKTSLPFNVLGSNIRQNIEQQLKEKMEGKCMKEGYIKPDSIRILSYSSGVIKDKFVEFQVSFECLVCRPVEGQRIHCIAKNITKAGIRAEHGDEPSPIIVFIARDHQYQNKYFSLVKENDPIVIRIIGIRFELNDTYISCIAELMNPKKQGKKLKIILTEKDNKNKIIDTLK